MKYKNLKKTIFIILTVSTLAAVIVTFTSCKSTGGSSRYDTEGMETFEVIRGDIKQTITASGYVDNEEENKYSLQSTGEVLLALKKGAKFSKGDLLIKIDNSRMEFLLAQTEESINIAKNSLELAQINYQQALDSHHVAVQLAETSTQQSELASQNALIALENANNMASKSRKNAEIALENAQKLLDVAKGDPLLTDTQVAQYEANVDSAEAGLDSAKASGRSSSESTEGAYEQSFLNQSTTYWSNLGNIQNVRAQIKIANKSIGQAEIQINLAQLNYELAKLDMDNNVIYAPYDGFVLSATFREGEYASPGISAIEIGSDEFLIMVDINETDITRILVGEQAEITLDAYPEEVFMGKVTEKSPVSKNIGGIVSFEVTIKPETENTPELLGGLSANLTIIVHSVENVLLVPIESVIEENGKQFVEIITNDEEIVDVEVVTGIYDYNYIEIKSGITQGDTVIISRTE